EPSRRRSSHRKITGIRSSEENQLLLRQPFALAENSRKMINDTEVAQTEFFVFCVELKTPLNEIENYASSLNDIFCQRPTDAAGCDAHRHIDNSLSGI